MGFSDVGRTSLKNNKRSKQKMFASYKEIPTSRKKNQSNDVNPHINNMSKSERKKYRKKLELEHKKKQVKFWSIFLVLFIIVFIYLIIVV